MHKNRITTVRTVKLNRLALLATVALLSAAGLSLYLLQGAQERRMSREALATARRLRDTGEPDLAARHLSQHLGLHPDDVEALALRAELLAAAARGTDQYLGAAQAQEQLVRSAPDAPASQAARRRLADLYVKYGESTRSGASSQISIELATLESRFQAAAVVARQLIDRGADDAGAHLLLAKALDGLAVPGDRKALNDAVREYRTVLAADPGEVDAAERLAAAYQDRLRDTTRAERVLDDLLAARPKSAAVRLVRYRFYAKARLDDRAAVELEQATRLAPEDLSVLISAAEHALRRGDTAGARLQLAKVPAAAAGDVRVLMTRGLIDFGDEQPEEAVDAWRKGLRASSGTDEEVTWWLTYSLLQLGRVSEAVPLLGQYRRLVGEDAPLLRFLEAQLDERNGMPYRALAALGMIRQRLDNRWETMIHVARGRCYESLWDESKAIEEYTKAIQSDPTAVVPRLSVAKIRLKRRPDEAAAEIRRGLALMPADPSLRVALAAALLRKEADRPAPRRDWAEFDRAWAKAAESSPNASAVVLMNADRMELDGRGDEAVRVLEAAARDAPRSAVAAIALADGLSRRGRTGPALDVLKRASAAAGDRASLRVARARALVALDRGGEARGVLTRDLGKLPPLDQSQVWMALGRLEAARGDAAAARRAFEEWARLVPGDPRPRLVLLDLALDQRDEPAARARVAEVLKLCGEADVAYRLARAKLLIFERDAAHPPEGSRDASLEEAGQLVEAVLSDAPELPAAQLLRAQVLERQGRIDEAINANQKSWEHGIEAALPRLVELLTRRRRFHTLAQLLGEGTGADPRVGLLSAHAFLRAGDADQASLVADQVARRLPDSAEASRWQARMLSYLGRDGDAEAALRALAERRGGATEPWLALLRFQAEHKRAPSTAEAAGRIKAEAKVDPPERVDAICLWAAGDSAGASKAYEAAIARRPDDLALRAEAARFYSETGRPVEAEAALREVLRRDPKNRPAARQLAVTQSARAADPAAWDQAWAALGPQGPETSAPEDRLARAVVLSRSPDPARRATAVGRLDELLADIRPDHPAAALARDYLARLLLEAGQPERASRVAAVSAGRGTDPASIALYAKALIQSKMPWDADVQLDRLGAISPGDPREAGLRARVIWDRSRPLEAAAALERAYADREGSPDAEGLGREAFLLLAGMGEEHNAPAERLGRRLARKHPALSWMPALVLARRGFHDEALQALRDAASATPAGREDLVETGRVTMTIAVGAANDPTTLGRAAAVLDAALRSDPAADELIVMSAMLRHVQGRYDEEASLYQTALEHRPESAVVLNNLAWVLSEGLHKPDHALKYADRLINVAGRTPQALDTRGVILTRLGRHDEAIRDLEDAVRREPGALHHLHLARALQRAGRTDDARKSRDLARRAGFSPKDLDPAEKADLQSVLSL